MLPALLPMCSYLREMIWGGRGLKRQYYKPLPPSKSIGESWEISAFPDMGSTVAGGPLSGWTLRRLVEAHGKELLGDRLYSRYAGEFPLLIKLLDAQQDLSIQVHPDDGYARKQGLGKFGKAEAWYVLHSDDGQIACGLKDGVGKPEFEAAVRGGGVEDVVQFFTVQPGDVISMPPGTVHALCKGVMVYEVQQSSDLTFRIYDYKRPSPDGRPRELHIDRALDVITFGDRVREPLHWRRLPGAQANRALLVESDHFRLERFSPAEASTEHTTGASFAALTLLCGNAEIRTDKESCRAFRGDTVLIPAGRAFVLTRQDDTHLEYLVSSVP